MEKYSFKLAFFVALLVLSSCPGFQPAEADQSAFILPCHSDADCISDTPSIKCWCNSFSACVCDPK
ncbi:hypothetical protein CJ030_MR1G010328 [Morella rubra]|uniref:Uncharacterized protein n=1 Tax=Morella rubra TaxID=262757 RepID=A0A6A1WJK1_9ROSI|nr:hypothetical protein CJ030_MR1G010328 [Morella rubra]